MEIYKRPFNNDPVLTNLIYLLLENHVPNADTKYLMELNRDKKGFTEITKNFAILDKTFLISYDLETIIVVPGKHPKIGFRVTVITLYKDLMEYEREKSVITKSNKNNPSLN